MQALQESDAVTMMTRAAERGELGRAERVEDDEQDDRGDERDGEQAPRGDADEFGDLREDVHFVVCEATSAMRARVCGAPRGEAGYRMRVAIDARGSFLGHQFSRDSIVTDCSYDVRACTRTTLRAGRISENSERIRQNSRTHALTAASRARDGPRRVARVASRDARPRRRERARGRDVLVLVISRRRTFLRRDPTRVPMP